MRVQEYTEDYFRKCKKVANTGLELIVALLYGPSQCASVSTFIKTKKLVDFVPSLKEVLKKNKSGIMKLMEKVDEVASKPLYDEYIK